MNGLYKCRHCLRNLPNERVFMKHECTQMVRSKEIQTQTGQMAYGLYKHWLEKARRKAPPIETFCTSAYYSSMMKFADWVKVTGIPDPKKYVELMLEGKVAPALWRRPESYQMYLEYVDKRSNPFEQAEITIETILALSDGLGVPPGEVFKSFKVGEILELIQQRRLSPWLLFCSKSFKDWTQSLHETDKQLLMKSIGIDYWAMRLEKSPDVVRSLKEIAGELGI